ncbi:MAG: hypothetical protein ACRCYG_15605, partial [Aeromonas veronii]
NIMSYPFYPGRGRYYPQPNDWRWGDRYPHPDECYEYNPRHWGYKNPPKRSGYRSTDLYPRFIQHYQSHAPRWSEEDIYWRQRVRRPLRQPRSTSGKRGGSKDKKFKQKQGKQKKKQSKKNKRGQNNKQIEDAQNEKFRALVKKLFELLRSFHHLEKVSIHTEVEPPTFLRLTHFLGDVVKPANVTPETKALLEGNAKNWAYTTRLILQDHYIQLIENESETLQEALIRDWDTALRVAAKWYRKRYPKKHMQEPIKKVEALLLSLGQGDRGVEKDTEAERATSVITEEDFPPLSRATEPSSPPAVTRERTPPLSLSPLPIVLPRRIPRPIRRTTVQVSPPKNPAVARSDQHPELLEIQPEQGTQRTLSHVPKPQERALPQVDEQRESSSTVAQVHAIREISFAEGDSDPDPLVSFEDKSGEAETLSLMDTPCPSTGIQVSGCL